MPSSSTLSHLHNVQSSLRDAEVISDLLRSLRIKYAPLVSNIGHNSTLGVVLEDSLVIKGIVPGGPLDRDFDNMRVEQGDKILAIDGQYSTSYDTIKKMIIGDDVIGSRLQLTIQKSCSMNVIHVQAIRGSFSRIQAIGEHCLAFKEIVNEMQHGKRVEVEDILKIEKHFIEVIRFSSMNLEELTLHVLDLEELALRQERYAEIMQEISGKRQSKQIKTIGKGLKRHARRRGRIIVLASSFQTWYMSMRTPSSFASSNAVECENVELKRKIEDLEVQLAHLKIMSSQVTDLTIELRKAQFNLIESQRSFEKDRVKHKLTEHELEHLKGKTSHHEKVIGNFSHYAAKITTRMQSISASEVLVQWHKVLSNRKMIHKRLARMHCLVVSDALVRWQESLRGKNVLKGMALRVVQMLIRAGLVMAYERWCEQVQKHRELRMKAGKGLMRLLKARLVMAFAGWQDHIIEEKQVRSQALKIVQRLMTGALVSCFERWRDHIIEKKQMKSKALRVVQMLIRAGLVMAYERWCEQVQKHRELRMKAGKGLMRLLKARLVMAFAGWQDRTIEEKQVRSQALKIVQRLMTGALVSCFERWRDHIIEKKQMKSRALRVVQMLIRAGLVMAYERWCEQVQKHRELRMKAGKGLMRLLKARLVMAFAGWQDHIIEEKQVRSQALKIVQRLMTGALVSCFERWRDHIIEKKQMKSRALMAYERWCEQVQKHRELRMKAGKVLMRLLKARLVMAFAGWQDHIIEEKQMKRIVSNAELREEIAVLQASYRALEQAAGRLVKEAEESEQAVVRGRSALAESEKELASSQTRARELQRRLEETTCNTCNSTCNSICCKEGAALKTSKDDLQPTLSLLQDQVSSDKTCIGFMEATIAGGGDCSKALTEKMERMEAARQLENDGWEDCEREMVTLSQALENMTQVKKDLESRLETAQAEAGMMKSRAEDLARTLDETTKAGNAACVTNAELRGELDTLKASYRTLEQAAVRLGKEVEEYEQDVGRGRSALAEVEKVPAWIAAGGDRSKGAGLSRSLLEGALGTVKEVVQLCDKHVASDSPLAATLAQLKESLFGVASKVATRQDGNFGSRSRVADISMEQSSLLGDTTKGAGEGAGGEVTLWGGGGDSVSRDALQTEISGVEEDLQHSPLSTEAHESNKMADISQSSDAIDSNGVQEAVADVVEQEAGQGASSETVEEAAAAIPYDHKDQAGISEPYTPAVEVLTREVEQAAIQEEARTQVAVIAAVAADSDKLQLTRLLEQFCLEDEADVLASNGINKDRDLPFIDDDVIRDLTLTPVSKSKLRKLVKALGAPAPERTSEPVQEAGDEASTEVARAAPHHQDAVEKSVDTSDEAVAVADEEEACQTSCRGRPEVEVQEQLVKTPALELSAKNDPNGDNCDHEKGSRDQYVKGNRYQCQHTPRVVLEAEELAKLADLELPAQYERYGHHGSHEERSRNIYPEAPRVLNAAIYVVNARSRNMYPEAPRVVNAEVMIAKMSRHERAWEGECERSERLSIPASLKGGLKDSLYFSADTKSRVKVTYADAKRLARLATPVCLKHEALAKAEQKKREEESLAECTFSPKLIVRHKSSSVVPDPSVYLSRGSHYTKRTFPAGVETAKKRENQALKKEREKPREDDQRTGVGINAEATREVSLVKSPATRFHHLPSGADKVPEHRRRKVLSLGEVMDWHFRMSSRSETLQGLGAHNRSLTTPRGKGWEITCNAHSTQQKSPAKSPAARFHHLPSGADKVPEHRRRKVLSLGEVMDLHSRLGANLEIGAHNGNGWEIIKRRQSTPTQ